MFCIIHASAQNEDPRHRRIAPRDTIRSAEVAIVSSSTGQLVDATLAVDITTTSSTDHVITTVLVPFPSSTTDCVYGCSTLLRPPYTGGNKAGITGKSARNLCHISLLTAVEREGRGQQLVVVSEESY